jgi:hypothetical protein
VRTPVQKRLNEGITTSEMYVNFPYDPILFNVFLYFYTQHFILKITCNDQTRQRVATKFCRRPRGMNTTASLSKRKQHCSTLLLPSGKAFRKAFEEGLLPRWMGPKVDPPPWGSPTLKSGGG